MSLVELYCDGCCLYNPGPGGWAFLLRTRMREAIYEKEGSGCEAHTTNNRMELMAAIQGLKALKKPSRVHVYTDSNYVVKGMKEWIVRWKSSGWKNANKKPVTNQDLWQELDLIRSFHQVEWNWVKGHSGHPENERVDQLAKNQAKSYL